MIQFCSQEDVVVGNKHIKEQVYQSVSWTMMVICGEKEGRILTSAITL